MTLLQYGEVMDVLEFARKVLTTEARALDQLAHGLDESFVQAVEMMLDCRGTVVITGVGKPWLIGQKISATLASTGTPSFALHPAEAAHGDLGRVREQDLVIALSNSGQSEEVVRLLPLLKRYGVRIIGITSNSNSDLARCSDLVLNLGAIEEACPHQLAPSTSTTAMLALGDALALCVMERRGFTREDYARFHPGGLLGRRLMRVEEVMRSSGECAIVGSGASVKETLLAITSAQTGSAVIVENGKLLGVFTDGDLRRHLERRGETLAARIGGLMTSPGIRIQKGELAQTAMRVMETRRIAELPVVDEQGMFMGQIQLKDLLSARMM